jgi:hypothetical protein
MSGDPRLENYLTSLERVLQPFPVSDRAEIVTEIKSHVLSTLERDPEACLDAVLSSLGEPETVANRYLMERGLKPTKPPVSPMVKWIVIGFLGTFAMLLLFVGIILVRFTPLVHVDDNRGKVSLLGGIVEVEGKNAVAVLSDALDGDGVPKSVMSGSQALEAGQSVVAKFNNGKVELTNASDGRFSWHCTGLKGQKPVEPATDKDSVTLDLTGMSAARCEFSLPENAKIEVTAANGKVSMAQAHFNAAVTLGNGKVSIQPDEARQYRYDLVVSNGKVENFASSQKPGAYAISVHLGNGKIGREE